MTENSYLLFGPSGTGKKLLAKVFITQANQGYIHFSTTTAFLANPFKVLKDIFNQSERVAGAYIQSILFENIDDIFFDLRDDRLARRFLLEKINDCSIKRLFFATAQNPKSMMPDEILAFHNVWPIFYSDEPGRLQILEIHARKKNISLSNKTLKNLARDTEWWSGEELEKLIESLLVTHGNLLSDIIVKNNIKKIGEKVVTEPRKSHSLELVEFAKRHCTNNSVLSSIKERFQGGSKTDIKPFNTIHVTIQLIFLTVIMDLFLALLPDKTFVQAYASQASAFFLTRSHA